MKKIYIVAFLLNIVLLSTSCKKWLNINKNPNSAEAASVKYNILYPQALTYTASVLSQYNSYGATNVGYVANAGGYGSLGTLVTYAYTGSDYGGLWSNAYDNLEDYKSIKDQTETNDSMAFFNATAKIMSTVLYENLVDAYNDIPYTNATYGGSGNYTPTYDSGTMVYKSLLDTLDLAIAKINTGMSGGDATISLGSLDVMFDGDMSKWKQFANTIKLRLLVKGNGKVNFSNKTFTSDGFLSTDALVNPGYSQSIATNGASQQNPRYNSLIFNYQGTYAYKVWLPSTFILTYYNGNKLSDPGRGGAMYYNFPNTLTNQLGNQGTSAPSCPDGTPWWPAQNRTPIDTTGAFKGPSAGAVIITAAESYFLQAEAALNGIVTGDVKSLLNSGITASFQYLYSLPTLAITGNPTSAAATYLTNNSTSKLVNYDLTTTTAEKLETIITQKYIALNMISSDQAWDDYRRTGYPTIVSTAGATATQTFASTLSQATRPDHLPSRIAYPTSEVAYNSANMPQNISVYTSLIFWAKP